MIKPEDHLSLVHFIAQRFRGAAQKCGEDYEDIVGAGCEGLVLACRDFDPTLGFAFSTFAASRIRGRILIYLRERGGPVKIPRRIREIANFIRKYKLEDAHISEIATKAKCSKHLVEQALDSFGVSVTALQQPSLYDENLTLENLLPSYADYSNSVVGEFLGLLTDRERKIIEMRMQGKHQGEIGQQIGVTQVHVCRLLKKIAEKYRIYDSVG